MTSPKVTLYSLSTCSHCKSSKKLLRDLGVDFDFVDVDLLKGDERKNTIAEVKRHNERCSFPTMLIGDTVIVGYKEKEIREALEK